jgi:protein-L-isoaspartate(D-aspartate) O-methyltransferase
MIAKTRHFRWIGGFAALAALAIASGPACPRDLRAQDRDQVLEELRDRMVDEQIVARGITDKRVIEAMRRVPRHLFVPPELVSQAYEDHPLSIGWGQTISQPYIVAFMTQAVDLEPTSRVLEVGTGSGYQAAVLAQICDRVYTVEIVPELAERAATVLKALGYANIHVTTGDGYEGWPEHAPYDAIIVTCSPTHVPAPLVRQLAEGGRMIIPIEEDGNQSLVLMGKKDGRLTQRSILPVLFVPMVDKKGRIR